MRGILTDDLKDEIEDLCDEITSNITSQPSYDSSQTSTTLSQPTQSKSQQDQTQLPPTVHRGFQPDTLPAHQYHPTPVHGIGHQQPDPRPSGSNMYEDNGEDILHSNTQPITNEYNGDDDSDIQYQAGADCSSDNSDDLTQVQSD